MNDQTSTTGSINTTGSVDAHTGEGAAAQMAKFLDLAAAAAAIGDSRALQWVGFVWGQRRDHVLAGRESFDDQHPPTPALLGGMADPAAAPDGETASGEAAAHTQPIPAKWDEATYQAFDEMREAFDDFEHKMHAGRIRTSGDTSYIVAAWDVLGEAVGKFIDHFDT